MEHVAVVAAVAASARHQIIAMGKVEAEEVVVKPLAQLAA
jgi:hypothetical protein